MKRDIVLTQPYASSFLSCEKDTETILKKLFITSQPYSNILKRLLVIQTEDCLDETKYIDEINNWSLKRLIDEGYLVFAPLIQQKEHETLKSRIVVSYNHFVPNSTNPEFRDCSIDFDILCPTEEWQLKDYQLRPMKIAGYIDSILNNAKLSGIGTLQFTQGNLLLMNPRLSGFSLSYWAVHGTDDQIPNEK